HRLALERTLEAIDDAARWSGEAHAPELVAAGLRRALDLVGELAGRLTPDEVLGRIFAGFCIGK
ncbi:MAG: tRNA uridine-5-carboxymethylaminomethyl(34) synthesis GTPase MnmE, partial [Phycisphaerales bacterium]|nr:tRNA uridine-5-carboxymethylaminomethyl(34) synthesis GTPase MnmE [Phycisphaerales bacterium]